MSDADETAPKDATEHTRAANRAARETLPLHDTRDFDDAARGFIGAPEDPVVHRDGRPIVDLRAHDFVSESEEPPDTVHPSLWRHARANNHHGLFEVVPGVYQLRGMDLANITIVEGDTGIIVIDPLSFAETARAALALYRRHRGDRPVTGLIYTHSHVDHFSGSRSILEDAHGGPFPIIAPDGFLYEAAAENVYAGTAMTRRALYMYGPLLPPGPRGQVDAGLANAVASGGSATLVPPTDLVKQTGETRTVDGVEMAFQMAPGTEAPAEMLIHFPAQRLLCVAEDANHLMHNLYTLRGAQVRDAATWWKVLNETIRLFGDDSDVLVGQHGWPRWGTADIRDYLENQRDLYKFIHDETLRLANRGLTMTEIAEQLRLPEGLEKEWYSHGYYGSLSHNAKAVYQRYLGWYDSHPAHLNQLPPTEVGPRYVEFMGGADAVVEKARRSYDDGDYRWVAEVLTHVVFADPGNRDAALLQADAFEQLGYQCENPTWRNEYLMGALELRNGVRDLGDIQLATADVFAAMTPEMILDFAGIKLDATQAAGAESSIGWTITDAEGGPADFLLELRNGVLVYTRGASLDGVSARARSTKPALAAALFGGASLDEATASGDIELSGDSAAVGRIFGMLDAFPLWFPIVQP